MKSCFIREKICFPKYLKMFCPSLMHHEWIIYLHLWIVVYMRVIIAVLNVYKKTNQFNSIFLPFKSNLIALKDVKLMMNVVCCNAPSGKGGCSFDENGKQRCFTVLEREPCAGPLCGCFDECGIWTTFD